MKVINFKIKREIILSVPQLNLIDKALECYEDKLIKKYRKGDSQDFYNHEFYHLQGRVKSLLDLSENMIQAYEAQEVEK